MIEHIQKGCLLCSSNSIRINEKYLPTREGGSTTQAVAICNNCGFSWFIRAALSESMKGVTRRLFYCPKCDSSLIRRDVQETEKRDKIVTETKLYCTECKNKWKVSQKTDAIEGLEIGASNRELLVVWVLYPLLAPLLVLIVLMFILFSFGFLPFYIIKRHFAPSEKGRPKDEVHKDDVGAIEDAFEEKEEEPEKAGAAIDGGAVRQNNLPGL